MARRTAPGGCHPLLVAAAGVAAWAALAGWIGYGAIDGSWARTAAAPVGAAAPGIGFSTILTTNLAAALLLYSGAATGGLTTLLATTWTGGYVGATLAVSLHNAGAAPVLGRVWIYLPLELGSLLAAGVAGAYPLVASLLPAGADHPPGVVQRYLRACRTSLALVALSAAGLVLAALVESTLTS